MMHYVNYVKLLALICICLPMKSAAKPAKELGDTVDDPNERDVPDLSTPHPSRIFRPSDPMQISDPDNIDGVDEPVINNEDAEKQKINIQDHGTDEGNESDELGVSFDDDGKSVEDPNEGLQNDDVKGDVGGGLPDDTPPDGTPSTTLNGAAKEKVGEDVPPMATPQQLDDVPMRADRPSSLDPVDKALLPPTAQNLDSPVPFNPVVSIGNLLTTTSVSPKQSESPDKNTFGVGSEAANAPIPVAMPVSSTQSINEIPSTEKSSPVSDIHQFDPKMQSDESDDQSNPSLTLIDTETESPSNQHSVLEDALNDVAVVPSNQTLDDTEKLDKDESSDAVTLAQTRSIVTTTEFGSRKSSTQIATEKAVTPDTTISSQKLTETMHPDQVDHTEYSLPVLGSITIQQQQSTLLLSNLAQPTNSSDHVTTSSSSLQLTPTGSRPQNESRSPATPAKADSNEAVTSAKSVSTTLTPSKNLVTTADVSTSLSVLGETSTTVSHPSPIVATVSPTTASTISTKTAIPVAKDTSKYPPTATSSTTISTTTITASPAKPSPLEPPLKSDATVNQETENSRRRPSVGKSPGREGESNIDVIPPEVDSPTLPPVSISEASMSGNSTKDQDFLSKVKSMVGNVEPFYIALSLLITLTIVLITCCCCCKLCSKKRRGIRHRRLKEYGKEKEFLLRDRGKSNSYQNDSVTLLQGSSEDEF